MTFVDDYAQSNRPFSGPYHGSLADAPSDLKDLYIQYCHHAFELGERYRDPDFFDPSSFEEFRDRWWNVVSDAGKAALEQAVAPSARGKNSCSHSR